MADNVIVRGPVTVANLTAAAGVTTTVDGWWPCLDITWRTPVPASVTKIVAQVREQGGTTVAETVLTAADLLAGTAKIVNGVSVGQHLEVRLSPAGAPGLPFQATPWLEVTTSWDALMAALDGLSVGCFKIVCGAGVPTRTDLPNGSLYVREDVSQLWRYAENGGGTSAQAVNIVGTSITTGSNTATLTGFDPTKVVRFSKPLVADSLGRLTWDAYSAWPSDGYTGAGAPPVIGQTWQNFVSIYGNNGGSDVLLWSATLSANNYLTAAAAYAALAAQLPQNLTGYATYKVVAGNDPSPSDNRGGLSVLVEELTPGWVLMSDLTVLKLNGVTVESAPRSIDFVGDFDVTTDGAGAVTVTAVGPHVDIVTSEAVTAGQVGSFHSSSGAKVRKANATDDSKQAQCFFLDAFASGSTARCYLIGAVISGLSSLTPGATYFLSTTGGGITTTPPTTAGQWLQEVGVAASATELVFMPRPGVLL